MSKQPLLYALQHELSFSFSQSIPTDLIMPKKMQIQQQKEGVFSNWYNALETIPFLFKDTLNLKEKKVVPKKVPNYEKTTDFIHMKILRIPSRCIFTPMVKSFSTKSTSFCHLFSWHCKLPGPGNKCMHPIKWYCNYKNDFPENTIFGNFWILWQWDLENKNIILTLWQFSFFFETFDQCSK